VGLNGPRLSSPRTPTPFPPAYHPRAAHLLPSVHLQFAIFAQRLGDEDYERKLELAMDSAGPGRSGSADSGRTLAL